MIHALAAALALVLSAPASASLPAVIPLPREMVATPGAFALPPAVRIEARDAVASDTAARDAASVLADELRARGRTADVGGAPAPIRLVGGTHDARLGDEGYALDVGPSGVTVAANTGTGLFYGVQTLVQLVDGAGANGTLAGVHVIDRPEYRWRGIHLDVSRHFFPVPVVERYIDLAARYKLNTFHWHLTDDQGWRLEIKRYPRLTTVGGCRAGSQAGGPGSGRSDGRPVCGWYTQDQVREVVAYAARRHVTIVPEIEMPGHAVEVLAAYPQFGCGHGPYATRELWGISSEILCPTEQTFAFVDDVLGEVAALFPGPYVHIGGDEVPKTVWRTSPVVVALMQREHLPTYDAVQGYFARRVEALARKHGKRIVGWDEIVAGGASADAIVMVWHEQPEATHAALAHNDVVMTPDPTLYFDAYQGSPRYEPLAIGSLTTAATVYDYRPPAGAHVLGVQGNLWTEFVPTAEQLWYMAFPRELALAEIGWTPSARLNAEDFAFRLGPALARLERDGVPFRIPAPAFRAGGAALTFPDQQFVRNHTSVAVAGGGADVALSETVPDAAIRYTLDGSLPSASSPLYAAPLHVSLAPGGHATVAAIAVLHDGRRSAPAFLDLSRPAH